MGQTGHCAVSETGSLPIISLSLWLNFAYDTCIFVAVSVRLTSYTTTAGPWTIAFARGHGLPRTMRRLLHDGQAYYLYVTPPFPAPHGLRPRFRSTNLVATLAAATIALAPVGPVYQAIFTVPATATEAIMTCSVFRAMVLRADRDRGLACALHNADADASVELSMPVELRQFQTRTDTGARGAVTG